MKCKICGLPLKYCRRRKTNNWCHVRKDRSHRPIPDYVNKIMLLEQEQMRAKKCYEIKSYIEYLHNNTNRFDENRENYNEWLKWWQTTPIEEIIEVKGDYKLWCTPICTPEEEQKFKDEILYKPNISLQDMENRLNKINKNIDILDEYLVDGMISETKYKEFVQKYKTESEILIDQIINKRIY